MTTKTRLNMEHGFMQCIIKNQLDRDNYDKEMKAKAGKKVVPPSLASKSKKPDLHTYTPPMARCPDATQPNKLPSESYLFTFEYEDENGELHHLVVNKGDNGASLAKQFGEERKLETAMIEALASFLNEQIAKHAKKNS